MTNYQAETLTKDTILTLKPERQKAYGAISPFVRFIRTQDDGGYKTPWLVCDGMKNGGTGWYRPSDFKKP